MKEFTDKLKKASEKIKSFDGKIHVVSHLDTDGITSAAIIASILIDLEKDFQISFIKEVNKKTVDEIISKEPKFVIFTDIGSGYLDHIKRIDAEIIIIDHHEVVGKLTDKMLQINPVEYDMEYSGSATAYMLAKEMLNSDHLAPLAIVGTIGDVAYSTDSKLFETNQVESEKGLKLYGRNSRPLYLALRYFKMLKLPDSSKALQFLSEIGIDPQENGKWRTYGDLTEEEKKKLTDAVVKESLKQGNYQTDKLFGDILTFKNYPEELKDAKEFATLLNACANMNEPDVGVGVCLGSKAALKRAKGLVRGYKRLLGNYMTWVRENPDALRQTDNATYIIAGDNINDNLIGTIVSMLFNSSEKILVGFSNAEDGVKISIRSKDIDIHEMIVKAAETCGGEGGGHSFAAGGKIPFGKEKEFIEACENILRKTL